MPFKIIATTNRTLCPDPLPARVAALCKAGIDRVIVREKDLIEDDYRVLLRAILDTIAPEDRDLITVNTFVDVAQEAGIVSVQLSYEEFCAHPDFSKEFHEVGVSVHGVAEAQEAERRGADYLICGHIFPTACKAGVPARGVAFLQEVCSAVGIPVYGIGGIDATNIASVRAAGADGACLMSDLMSCTDVYEELGKLRAALSE